MMPAFSEAIEDGKDGFVAKTTEEWVKKIEMLIIDSKLRSDMGKTAREKALSRNSTKTADNTQYYDYIRNKISY